MRSSTPNREVASLLAAGAPVRKSGSTCTTPALVFPSNKFRGSSKRSLGLKPQSATVSASVSSSCGRRSESWVIASTLPQLPVAGLAFPFSSHDPKGVQTKLYAAQGEKRRAIGRKSREHSPGAIPLAHFRKETPFPTGMNDIDRSRLLQRRGMGEGAVLRFDLKKG